MKRRGKKARGQTKKNGGNGPDRGGEIGARPPRSTAVQKKTKTTEGGGGQKSKVGAGCKKETNRSAGNESSIRRQLKPKKKISRERQTSGKRTDRDG